MKRKIISLCVFWVTMVLLSSCFLTSGNKYYCNIDEIERIQIVELGDYDMEDTVLLEIEDLDNFVNRLNKIERSTNFGAPGSLFSGYIVIKIDYINGNCDLLYRNAQVFFESDTARYGHIFFDKEQFNALISDYLPDYKPQ